MMEITVDPKTQEWLEKLAAKLGTTVEHLWEVLIRQAQVEAWAGVGAVAGFTLLFLAAAVVLYLAHTKTDDNNLVFFNILVTGGVAALWVLSLIVNYSEIYTGFFNPEYSALQVILNRR